MSPCIRVQQALMHQPCKMYVKRQQQGTDHSKCACWSDLSCAVTCLFITGVYVINLTLLHVKAHPPPPTEKKKSEIKISSKPKIHIL